VNGRKVMCSRSGDFNRIIGTVPLEIPKRLSGGDLYFFHNLPSDAHFSHDSPRQSTFDLPFTGCPGTGEPGSVEPRLLSFIKTSYRRFCAHPSTGESCDTMCGCL